jgi:dolichol-phosphate mannosyltransferase
LPKLVILLPTKNEEDGIREVFERIPVHEIAEMGYSIQVVVADGNSKDRTCEIAAERGAKIVVQKGQDGKGTGVREALEVIFQESDNDDETLLIMLDADATYSPEDLPRFIDSLSENEVVWGSRMRGKIAKRAMSRTNRLGNWLLSAFASIVFLKRTSDLCTGYWGFRISVLETLDLTAEGFNLEADLFD